MDRRTVLKLPLLAGAAHQYALAAAEAETAPVAEMPGALKFCVMGDSGSGAKQQLRIADQMLEQYGKKQWEFVAMMGDNIYENGEPEYFDSKFVDVYREMLDQGIPFRATLGNHDVRYQDGRAMVQEEAFGFVDRKKEYEFYAGPELEDGKRLARFICLDSNQWIDAIAGGERRKQEMLLGELRERLDQSDKSRWNIFYFHHPIHSFVKSGFMGLIPKGHGSSDALQEVLEPEIREYADLVLAGHDHFYQKVKPQHGVHHIVSGGAGKLRKGMDAGHSQVEVSLMEYHFMDFSLGEDALHFQAINERGQRIHSGSIDRRKTRTLAEIAAA